MAGFIGALGGCLMIALIVILFCKFLSDAGVSYIKDNSGFILSMAGGAVLFYFLYLLFGSILYGCYHNSPDDPGAMLFDIRTVWNNMGPVNQTLDIAGAYSKDNFIDQGALPLYYIIVKGFGSLLFEMYELCAFYISFISGVVTYVSLGLFFRRKSSKGKMADICTVLLCFPGSILLFLPSSFSLFAALFGVFLLLADSDKGIASLAIAVLCCCTHISGIAALVLWAVRYIVAAEGMKALIRDIVSLISTQLIIICICAAMGWGTFYEYGFTCILCALIVYSGIEGRIKYGITSVVNVMLAVASGYYMVGSLTGTF